MLNTHPCVCPIVVLLNDFKAVWMREEASCRRALLWVYVPCVVFLVAGR